MCAVRYFLVVAFFSCSGSTRLFTPCAFSQPLTGHETPGEPVCRRCGIGRQAWLRWLSRWWTTATGAPTPPPLESSNPQSEAQTAVPKSASLSSHHQPTASRSNTVALWDWAPRRVAMQNAKGPKRYLAGLGTPIRFYWVLLGIRYVPLWCDGHSKECISLLSSSSYGLPWQGLWAATTTIALVRRWSGGLRCCMLTP